MSFGYNKLMAQARKNPFKPSFGVRPPLLVGREDFIDDFDDSLDEGVGSPGRITLYTGSRGTGKTVLLGAAEDRAKTRGWVVISETASPGLLTRIVDEHLPRILGDVDPNAVKRRLTGASIHVGANWETIDQHPITPGLRNQLTQLLNILHDMDSGLLITIDEIHNDYLPDLRELSVAIQHLIREDQDIAFIGAGLPSSVSTILNDSVLTFLRRADRKHLGPVPITEVREAIRAPILENGRTINDDALNDAAKATDGYPFLIQLVGYHSWKQHPTDTDITTDDVHAGIRAAQRRLGSLVYEPSIAATTDVDKSFLLAMAKDDGPSRMADIAARLGVTAGYAGQYRLRLIDAELIVAAGYGRVNYALPNMREYLRQHAASLVDLRSE